MAVLSVLRVTTVEPSVKPVVSNRKLIVILTLYVLVRMAAAVALGIKPDGESPVQVVNVGVPVMRTAAGKCPSLRRQRVVNPLSV